MTKTYTQDDLDRIVQAAVDYASQKAAQEARAVALREAAEVAQCYHDKGQVTKPDDILALLDKPAAEALAARDERARAEERGECAKVAESWNAYANPTKSGLIRDCGIRNRLAHDIAAAIRARGET